MDEIINLISRAPLNFWIILAAAVVLVSLSESVCVIVEFLCYTIVVLPAMILYALGLRVPWIRIRGMSINDPDDRRMSKDEQAEIDIGTKTEKYSSDANNFDSDVKAKAQATLNGKISKLAKTICPPFRRDRK